MENNITDWKKYTLTPALFEVIDIALPEFNFTSYRGEWRSSLKLDGTQPKDRRADKTVVTKKRPDLILEQGAESISIVDYVMDRDNVDFITALKQLAIVAGLELPKGEYNQESYTREREQESLWEACNSYFVYCLENSSGAEHIRSYLAGRGYSEDGIKAMELGYLPSQDKLISYLQSKNFKDNVIKDYLALNKGIGSTHQLAIPYRCGGTIKGFKFRTIGDSKPKYLNTTGLDKSSSFFNIAAVRGDKDVIIVEGELDSLNATANGIDNVVAAGGNSISPEQVKDAIRRGAKSFTICFDYEPGQEKSTHSSVINAIDVIKGNSGIRVYIATLPNIGGGKTDPDRLIREKGIEAFQQALNERLTYGAYLGVEMLQDYLSKGETIDYKDRDLFRDKVIQVRSSLLEPTDRDDFNFHCVEPLRDHGFSEEILSELEESHRMAIEEAKRNRNIEELIARTAQVKNPADKLEVIRKGIKEIDTNAGKGLLPEPATFTALLDSIGTLAPALKTGYPTLDKFVGITPGAITLVAGRPSHGKTTFMFNMMLGMSQEYKDKTFYFFTYEEPLPAIMLKMITSFVQDDLAVYYKKMQGVAKANNTEFIKHYIRMGRSDIREIEDAKRKMQELIDNGRVKVIDKNYSVEQLSNVIRYLNKREQIGAIFIDYIQRMNTEKKTPDQRMEIAKISDSVLQLVKETRLPIVLGAQLNRDAKNGKGGLDNLKEAGNLEEDANTVLRVYSGRVDEEKDAIDNGENIDRPRIIDIEIKTLKNREGEKDKSAVLKFDRWLWSIKEPDITAKKEETRGYR